MPYQDSEAGREKQRASRLREIIARKSDPARYEAWKAKMRAARQRQRTKDPEGDRTKQRGYYHTNIERTREVQRNSSWRRRRDPACWAAAVLARIRGRCRVVGIPFNLTPADVVIPAVCPVFGVPFVFGLTLSAKDGRGPSIDRHVPALGYVKGNVSVISRRANLLKSDCTSGDELRKVAAYIDSINGAP